MTLTIPIAVRIYNVARLMDFHVTKWVEDFSFRHTAPGGCASCTIKLHIPTDANIDPQMWGKLFTRVQIIDKRDAEILWEGRVEDPVQRSGDDTWELGVLGSSVAATDINLPYIYMDNTLDHWRSFEADAYEHKKEETNKTLTSRMNTGYIFAAGTEYNLWTWTGGSLCGTAIARVTTTFNGTGPNTTQDDFFYQTLDGSIYGNVGGTNPFSLPGDFTQTVHMMDDFQWADGLINQIYYEIGRSSTNYTIGSSDQVIARFKNPKIQTLRVNRHGTVLQDTASYNQGDFVYVHQVVEDVIGRYLNNNWIQGPFLSKASRETEHFGSVKGDDAYVDISDVRKITNLQFTSGTNAKGILEALMNVQVNAYWAIWESSHLDTDATDMEFNPNNGTRFRFEWATWPEYPNYIVSSQDGMEQQMSAEDIYNEIFMRQTYESSDEPFVTYSDERGPWPAPGVVWDISETFEGQFDRSLFLDESSNPLPTELDNFQVAFTEGANRSQPVNVGTITIRRPIWMNDTGENSHHGYFGKVQPWEIRPGKLLMIKDIMPLAEAGNMFYNTATINPNPDFSNGTTGWVGTGGTFVQATDFTKMGEFSGKITPTGAAPSVFIATDWLPLKGTATYRARAWIRCAVARTVALRIDFYDGSNVFLGAFSDSKSIPANQWTLFEVQTEAPVGSVHGPMLAIMGSTPAASNVMWMSHATFQKLPDRQIPITHRNCIFRVAATNYDTANNSCQIELDQLPKWSVATQIANPGPSGSISTR